MTFPTVKELKINTKLAPAVLGVWLVRGKMEDSSYQDFIVALYHVRKVEGYPRPNKAKAAMTHELLITPLVATVPDLNIDNADEHPIQGTQIVRPVNVNLQFRAPNDARALYFVTPLVEMIKTGAVGVTRKWRQHWIQCIAQGTHYDVFHLQQEGEL